MKNIIEALKWRYATKKFDSTKKLSPAQVDTLIEATRLAPSSFGLAPWRLIVVTNPDIRQNLKAAGYSQVQIAEASHLFVFAVPTNLDEKYVADFIDSVAAARKAPRETLAEYEKMLNGALAQRSPEERINWAAKQAYIALGVLIAAGASESIDIGPMEGFDPKKFDDILGLPAMNLTSKVIAAAGFRIADDPFSKLPKFRLSKEKLVKEIK
jgi:nitroreductase